MYKRQIEDAALVLRPALAPSPLTSWVLAAGPHFVDVEIDAEVTVPGGAGGAALVLSYRDPLDYWMVLLPPGAPAALVEVVSGTAHTAACSGSRALDPLTSAPVSLRAARERLTVTVAEDEVLSCELPLLPRGLAGLGLPSGTSELRIVTFDVRRATP